MLTGCRWEYILHGRGVVVLTYMGVGQVLLFVYKTCGEGEDGVKCF